MVAVLVVGAGVSGLACAWELQRAGVNVLVVEASGRAGGVIDTLELDGYRFEAGPNTIQSKSTSFRGLCDELGIADELIVSDPQAKQRYLFHRGELRSLPSSPVALLRSPLLSLWGKLRVFSEPLHSRGPREVRGEEPTFEAFLARRIGREATRTLAGSFVRGVYAAEIGELGAKSAFPQLWSLVHDHGGFVRGMLASRREHRNRAPLPGPNTSAIDLLSFPRGLSTLTEALARGLAGHVSLHTPVQDVERGAGGWIVTLETGESLNADAVVLAVPAPAAHRMLAMAAPERLSVDALRSIRHASVTLVHLGLESTELPRGFGFLVPPDEAAEASGETPRALGILFPSNVFPGRAPEGCAAVTAIYRASDVEAEVGRGRDEALVDLARRDLELAVGAGTLGPTSVSLVRRWRDVIPAYGVGHERRMRELIQSLARALPGLELAGSYVGGVSVEDCIAQGRAVARSLARQAAQGGAA